MSEQSCIERTPVENGPITRSSLAHDFRALGLEAGMSVIVHSSMSALGWVCGGAVAVIQALEDILTDDGTLLMPTHSADLSDPAEWRAPPVPEPWRDAIRSEMPLFDPDFTPTREMGAIPETFRKQRGVLRSSHPILSFAAWGRHKDFLIQGQTLDFGMNDKSPLGRLYELGGSVLLLGVGHDSDTSLHLAEYRATWPGKTSIAEGSPGMEDGKKVWKERKELSLSAEDFPRIGAAYEAAKGIVPGKAGLAEARLIPQRDIVDFAVAWMELNRKA